MRFPRGVPREFLEKGERERERERERSERGGELSETGIICIVRAVRTHKFGTCIPRRVGLVSLSRAGKDRIHGNVACICMNFNRKSCRFAILILKKYPRTREIDALILLEFYCNVTRGATRPVAGITARDAV